MTITIFISYSNQLSQGINKQEIKSSVPIAIGKHEGILTISVLEDIEDWKNLSVIWN